jgi:hypothetical protein
MLLKHILDTRVYVPNRESVYFYLATNLWNETCALSSQKSGLAPAWYGQHFFESPLFWLLFFGDVSNSDAIIPSNIIN